MNLRALVTGTVAAVVLGGCAAGSTLPGGAGKTEIAAKANTQLGVEYLQEHNYELALAKLQKAIELQPDYSPAHDVIAILYAQVGDRDNAEKHYRRSLSLNPDNADTHSNYGQFLCSIGRIDEAEQQFRTASGNPYYNTPEVPLLNAGICMANKQDKVAAEKYYRLALEKNPQFAPALLRMAELEFSAQDYLKTRAWLQRYDQAGEYTPQSLWLGVRAEYALGDHQAWGNYALQLKNRFPDSAENRMLQEWENERRAGN